MPELNEVVGTETPATTVPTATVNATTIDPVIPATSEKKKKEKKAVSTEKKKKEVNGEESVEKQFQRPPIEQITKDFETYILDLKIGDHPIKKLGYKCGKIIFGLSVDDGKDLRVIAFKARKKTKAVTGKSRCIYYFGIANDTQKILKDIPGTKVSKFGTCSVQVSRPIDLSLDKVTYSDVFEKDADKVLKSLKKLADIAVDQKADEWKERTVKTAEKKSKKEKKEAAE